MEAVERAFNLHPPELRFELQYEELLERPQATLRRLVNWLGVRQSQEDLIAAREAAADKRAARTGGWRENLTPREQEIVASVMNYKLGELGMTRATSVSLPDFTNG